MPLCMCLLRGKGKLHDGLVERHYGLTKKRVHDGLFLEALTLCSFFCYHPFVFPFP
ncbi:hypothetical protein GK2119 [Geobacillus kaustophilus HTA426]|uniref:Uncharacterized protein n=1 Tax=Geobacillus kaustophilus (strain HTA426) TaxID=235909 RepID=Q5KY32_GEOKA|nr:hypothetical protein GK2119 [Geobacillus kaustophilus HTA426]